MPTALTGTPITDAVYGSFTASATAQAALTTAQAARAALVTTCNTKNSTYATKLAAWVAAGSLGSGTEFDELEVAIGEKNTADAALEVNSTSIRNALVTISDSYMPTVVALLKSTDGTRTTDSLDRPESVDARKLKAVVSSVIALTALSQL